MKHLMFPFLLAATLLAALSSAPEAKAYGGTHCVMYPPICAYGQSPICLCDGPYSYNCTWLCATRSP